MIPRICCMAMAICLAAPQAAPAEEAPARPRVAVLDLQGESFPSETLATLTGVLLSGLSQGGGLDVLGKADLGRILSVDQINQLLGCDANDARCTLERGRFLGNAILVWGSVGRVADKAVVTVSAVDMQAGLAIGRASRTVDADDGDDLIEATGELAAEIRALLGLESEATWTPIMAVSLRYGGFISGYVGGEDADPATYLHGIELEFNAFIIPEVPVYLKVGLTIGGGETGVVFVPATIGAKYRFIRDWLTPYIGLGLGLEFLDFDKESGNAFSLHVIGGLEINPWKRLGFCVDGGFNFSQYFNTDTKDLSQIGGKIHVGVIYRF
ncbi:MAG: outer membrane beta-barrel protein [Deltaproteobacteria bacterium]|nr:outer membrane beta-barrel protein [Deltaproteobacteria bacterium]